MGINRGPSLGFAVLLHQDWDPSQRSPPCGRPVQSPKSGSPTTPSGRSTTAAAQNPPPTSYVGAWRLAHPSDVVRINWQQRFSSRRAGDVVPPSPYKQGITQHLGGVMRETTV